MWLRIDVLLREFRAWAEQHAEETGHLLPDVCTFSVVLGITICQSTTSSESRGE